MTLASCCGPVDVTVPNLLPMWTYIALGCAVMLLGTAIPLFYVKRRSVKPWWRQRLAPALFLAGVIACLIAHAAWNGYQALGPQAVTQATSFVTYTGPATDAYSYASTFGPLVSMLLVATLALALIGTIELACELR